MCCSVLQCVAVYVCHVLKCAAVHCSMLQCVAVYTRRVLQCVAVCCSVLQCVAVHICYESAESALSAL